MTIEFLLNLVSLEDRFPCVDHNDVIAGVKKRGPLGTTLAAQN